MYFRAVADYEFCSCINRVFSKYRVFVNVKILISRERKIVKNFKTKVISLIVCNSI